MDIRKNIFFVFYFDPSLIRIFDNRFFFKLNTYIDEKNIFIMTSIEYYILKAMK